MSNNLDFFKSAIWKFILWLMRPKNIIFTTGRLFFVTGFGGGVLFNNFSIKHSSDNGNNIAINFSSDQIPDLIQNGLWLLGFMGALILIAEIIYISFGRSKTLVIGIEHIGLKKRISTPLSAFLGRAETIPIDLTVCYENDKVSNPEKALDLTKHGIEENLSVEY